MKRFIFGPPKNATTSIFEGCKNYPEILEIPKEREPLEKFIYNYGSKGDIERKFIKNWNGKSDKILVVPDFHMFSRSKFDFLYKNRNFEDGLLFIYREPLDYYKSGLLHTYIGTGRYIKGNEEQNLFEDLGFMNYVRKYNNVVNKNEPEKQLFINIDELSGKVIGDFLGFENKSCVKHINKKDSYIKKGNIKEVIAMSKVIKNNENLVGEFIERDKKFLKEMSKLYGK